MNYAKEQITLSQTEYSTPTIRNCAKNEYLSMAYIRNKEGEEFAKIVLQRLIEGLASSLNVGKNMNAEQIIECSELIMKQYFHYSAQHFKIAFDRFKMNRYPEIRVLDRFDITMIFQILERFDSELKDFKIKIEQEELLMKQSEWEKNAVPMPEDVKIELNNLSKKFTKKPEYQTNEPKEWSKTKEWIEEFEKIYKETGDKSNRIKQIKIDGLVMDRNGYLVYKLIENE